jgi:hypothetical protein
MSNSNNLFKIRNELSYLLRFGGVCSAIQFNPTNISNEISKSATSSIINSINEYMWNRGIDIISTNYANGGCGFMLLTTHSNKDAMKEIISNLDIKRNLNNEYLVEANSILDLSVKNNNNLYHVIFTMKIIDNYKTNTRNQLSMDLNENSNITDNIQICERSIVNHLRNLNLINEETDSGLLSILGDVFKTISENSKKYAVHGLVIVALFYALNYIYQKWRSLEQEKKLEPTETSTTQSKSLKALENSFAQGNSNEPNEPNEPAEPAEPAEPSDFEVNLTTRTVHNRRISTLLKTLEDSEVKQNKTTNIEAKILSLLAETTESR